MKIEKDHFDTWMSRLMDRIDSLEDSVSRVIKRQNCVDGEELLDNKDLMFLLKTSRRSLQRYHKEGTLPFFYMNGKTYHKHSDVLHFIRNHYDEKTNT